MVKRQGLGAVRHLATADPWIQQKVHRRQLGVGKVGTRENPADVMTKILSFDHMLYLWGKLGMNFTTGRAAVAPIRAKLLAAPIGLLGSKPAV